MNLKVGDLILYNFLFSNEESKYGIVCHTVPDLNFFRIVYIISDEIIDRVPYNIMEYEIIQ